MWETANLGITYMFSLREFRRCSKAERKKFPDANQGPSIMGEYKFDRQYMFGNEMDLTEEQVAFLVSGCTYNRPKIKYYVYKMTSSSTNDNICKTEFGAQFTRRYLKNCLDKPIDLQVEHMESSTKTSVRMKMGVSNRSIITSGWFDAVMLYKIYARDISLFSFWINKEGKLSFLIAELPPSVYYFLA